MRFVTSKHLHSLSLNLTMPYCLKTKNVKVELNFAVSNFPKENTSEKVEGITFVTNWPRGTLKTWSLRRRGFVIRIERVKGMYLSLSFSLLNPLRLSANITVESACLMLFKRIPFASYPPPPQAHHYFFYLIHSPFKSFVVANLRDSAFI